MILKVKNLSVDFQFDSQAVSALRDICFQVAEGESVGLSGRIRIRKKFVESSNHRGLYLVTLKFPRARFSLKIRTCFVLVLSASEKSGVIDSR